MIKINDKLCNNEKTREELLNVISIEKTRNEDFYNIVPIIDKCFGINSYQETIKQLLYSEADLENSVKLIDKTNGDIYGLLIFSKYKISIGTPIKFINNELSDFLDNYSQINGYAFIIDERLRGTSLDKKMMLFNKEYLESFDFIWCAVDIDLKTHNYWKRLGFEELIKIKEAIFYIKPKSLNIIYDIFIIKSLREYYEKNYS